MEEEIGRIDHFFANLGVAVLELTSSGVALEEVIHIQGHTTDFYQKVKSLQMEHTSVESASLGDKVGIKMERIARKNDRVYRVIDGA